MENADQVLVRSPEQHQLDCIWKRVERKLVWLGWLLKCWLAMTLLDFSQVVKVAYFGQSVKYDSAGCFNKAVREWTIHLSPDNEEISYEVYQIGKVERHYIHAMRKHESIYLSPNRTKKKEKIDFVKHMLNWRVSEGVNFEFYFIVFIVQCPFQKLL